MSISNNMARFTLDHTDDPEVAAACATTMGWLVTQASPKVSFPPKWVLAQKCPAKQMAFYVSHCDDPETLGVIAKRDKRKLVREALVGNPALPTVALGTLSPAKKAVAVAPGDGDPATRLETMLRASVTGRYRNYTLIEEVISLLDASATSLPSGPNKAISFLAEHDFIHEVLSYLEVSYGISAPKEQRSRGFVWDRVTIHPVSVLAKMSLKARKRTLTLFLASATGYTGRSTHIDPKLTTMMIETITPRGNALDLKNGPRHIFADESVDLLVAHPQWWLILAGQKMTDEQFGKLLEVTPPKRRIQLANVLHGSRARLVKLAETANGHLYKGRCGGLDEVLACISESGDELLEWVVPNCDPMAIADYLLGGWSGTGADQRVALCPRPEWVADLAKLLNRDTTRTVAGYFTGKSGDPLPPKEVMEAMLEYIPALASWTIGNSLAGAYTFSRLSGCGVPIEVALEQFESQGQDTTLEKLCRTLSTLAREGQQC